MRRPGARLIGRVVYRVRQTYIHGVGPDGGVCMRPADSEGSTCRSGDGPRTEPVPSPQSIMEVKLACVAVGVPSTKLATAPLNCDPAVALIAFPVPPIALRRPIAPAAHFWNPELVVRSNGNSITLNIGSAQLNGAQHAGCR